MSNLDLARWLAFYRTGKDVYARMARFWGRLFLISFALGVATGLRDGHVGDLRN